MQIAALKQAAAAVPLSVRRESPQGLSLAPLHRWTCLPDKRTQGQLLQYLPALAAGDDEARQVRWNFVLVATDSRPFNVPRLNALVARMFCSQLDPVFWIEAWEAAIREGAANDAPFNVAWPLVMYLSGRSAKDIRPQDLQAVFLLYDTAIALDELHLPPGKCIRVPEAVVLEQAEVLNYCDPHDNYLPAWFDAAVAPWRFFVRRSGPARD